MRAYSNKSSNILSAISQPMLSILDFVSQLWRKIEARLAVPKYEARVDGGHSLVVRAQAAQARGPPWV